MYIVTVCVLVFYLPPSLIDTCPYQNAGVAGATFGVSAGFLVSVGGSMTVVAVCNSQSGTGVSWVGRCVKVHMHDCVVYNEVIMG